MFWTKIQTILCQKVGLSWPMLYISIWIWCLETFGWLGTWILKKYAWMWVCGHIRRNSLSFYCCHCVYVYQNMLDQCNAFLWQIDLLWRLHKMQLLDLSSVFLWLLEFLWRYFHLFYTNVSLEHFYSIQTIAYNILLFCRSGRDS